VHFHNDWFGEYAKFITSFFGYDKVYTNEYRCEAVETAIKLLPQMGLRNKGIEKTKVVIIVCEGNFHGRTTGVISFSSDPDAKTTFGPFMAGFISIPYNDVDALEQVLRNKNVAGFWLNLSREKQALSCPMKVICQRLKNYARHKCSFYC
jgi:ornithine--oxo-acid transaminase